MHVEFETPDHAAIIERLLDGFIQAGELLIRAGAVGRPELDVVLQDDDVPSWQLPTQTSEKKTGDCEDLVIWWAAYLRATGKHPNARARIKNTGPLQVHCCLDLGNGRVVDVYREHLQAQERAGFKMGGWFSSLKNAVKKVGHAIGSGAGAVTHGIGSAASAVGHGVGDAAKAVYHGAGDAALAVGHGAEDVGRGVERATTAVYHAAGDAASAIGHVPGDIVRGVGGVVADVGHAAGDLASGVGGALGDVVGGAASLAADVLEAPTRFALDVGEKLVGDAAGALGIGGGGADPYAGVGPEMQVPPGAGYGSYDGPDPFEGGGGGYASSYDGDDPFADIDGGGAADGAWTGDEQAAADDAFEADGLDGDGGV